MAAATVRAFAKLNLTLEVLARRPDGFHALRTVYQTISLADRVDIVAERSRVTHVWCEADVDIAGDNLAVSAVHAALDMLEVRADVRIRLQKKIPMGGGLGGGSSNAAVVLNVLPGLLGKHADRSRLLEAAAALGSDVPLFLIGGTVLGLGRGTEVYPLPDLRPVPAILVTPGIHVSTAEAFRRLGRTASWKSARNSTGLLAEAIGAGEDWAALSMNDFESAVFERHPELARLRRKLVKAGAVTARMSGSGSSLFGVFATRSARDAALGLFGGAGIPVTFLPRKRYCRAAGLC